MDEIVKGVVETTSVPDNVEQLVKVNIKDGKASATLFANPNGSKIKQRLDSLEERFNNLKTINYEELYGPGNIDIKQGGDSGDVTKSYVDTQDNATYEKSKSYTDSKITDLRSYVDNASNTTLIQAKAYADSLSYGGGSGGGGDKSTVVLIDAVGRASQARSEAYTAYKAGKAIVLKCAANKFIPMTVVAESSNTVDLKGFDLSYSGYTVTPNVTLVTRMWTLDSTGLNYVEKLVPINSCRTFDCTNSSVIANTFANALDSYNNGFSVILKVDANTFVVANTVTTSSLTGYTFQFNTGTTSEGQTGIVSVDIIRWRLTSVGLSKDTFSTESISGGSGGGGGSVTLRQAFSTKTTSLAMPNNPDDDPTFWNQSSQTSASIWAAQKSTGNDWVIWKLQPQDGTNGTDGNGIADVQKAYAVSDSGTKTPADSEWKSTMPDAKPGQYIWCRITIKYTSSTSDTVYYTVSYIGKNGQDGAKGTPINIKGNLESKEKLPTSGNTNGDGYIIDKDLWVYDGNTITSDKTYNGFTNVGVIVGPDGKTSCFHRAWCNGDPANGDYTGFDTDAPDGSMFDYMGTYVDYVDSAEEAYNHPDSTDPTDYKWTRIRGVDGEDAITLDFDNDSDSIGLTYEGKVEYDQSISTNVGIFEGQKVMEIQNIECVAPDGMTIQTLTSGSGSDRYPGKLVISVKEGDTYIKNGSNNITVTVIGKCTNSEKTHVVSRVFHITGRKAGSPGESSVIYRLVLSNSEIRKFSDGSYSVNFVSVTKKQKKVGKAEWVDTTDGEIKYSIDESAEKTPCELNYGISVANVRRCIDFYLYVNGVLEDGPEHIPLNENGTIGESAKVVSETYRYAVSMSFTKTPNDLTAWSEEPIDIEPGQYLYTETKREWNNGDITYSYSWTRGGLNGYSNLPFVSTVFMRSSTQPDTPSGGDYNNPLPESDGWSDGVPEGTAKLWFSQRKFTIDGLAPQESSWSEPLSALSSSTLNIRYSSADECPKTPDIEPSSVWSSVPDLNSKWGAYQSIVNNEKQPWVLLQIKGEGSRIDTASAATPFMGEWDASTKYYGTKLRTDIVRVSGTSGADDPATYYYIANKAKNFDGVVTPQPGTTEGDKYWLRFGANYDNLATGFLFSEKIGTDIINAVNAKIDNLEVENIGSKIVDAINLSAKKAVFNDVIIIGSSRNPFTSQTDSFDTNYNDNISTYGGGSFSYAYTIPCDITQSGRLIRVVNFMWNSVTTSGTATISVSDGCCFFENGIRKESIVISREIVELLGYGDTDRFYGWIVVGRENLLTTKSYGRQLNILAQGVFSCGASPTIDSNETFTFDNTTLNDTASANSLSITRVSTGTFKVNIPSYWGLDSNGYIIMLTVLGRTDADNSIVTSVHEKTSTSFRFSCQSVKSNWIDDVKVMFMISNVKDWSSIKQEVDPNYRHILPSGVIDINREPMTVVADWITQPSESYKYLFASDDIGSLGMYKISDNYSNGRFLLDNDGYKNLITIYDGSPSATMYLALSNTSNGSVLERVSDDFKVTLIKNVLSDFKKYSGTSLIDNPMK